MRRAPRLHEKRRGRYIWRELIEELGVARAFTGTHRGVRLAAACWALLLAASAAYPQEFGRNKVRPESFDFRVIESGRFRVYFYESARPAAERATRMLEAWYDRHTAVLDFDLRDTQPAILYANHPDFQQTNVIGGLIPQGVGGVTEGLRNRILVPLTGVAASDDHVLGHELVHAFQFDISASLGYGSSGFQSLPLWFTEGMCEYLSIGTEDPMTAMYLRDAVLNDTVPSLGRLGTDPDYSPYRFGHAVWAYITAHHGDRVVRQLLDLSMAGGFGGAAREALGLPIGELSDQWVAAVRDRYEPMLEARTPPEQLGTGLVTGPGRVNVAPALSPDGRYVTFISQRDVFSLDLYLADARTGETVKKLVSANTDAHFDALRFMNATGAWSPDSARFAFVVVDDGDHRLALLDVRSRRILETRSVGNFDAITGVAWGPDGNRLAVAGTRGGISDLAIHDLRDGTTRMLTSDGYAELQPSFSPDGATLAFITDRGPDTSLEMLRYGPMRIGLMDLAGGSIETFAVTAESKHVSPQFSGDGESLYFIADPDGFSDVYRYDLQADTLFRVTMAATGVVGFTDLSPALTVSRDTGEIAFSVFHDGGYHIRALQAPHLVERIVDAKAMDRSAQTEIFPKEPQVVRSVPTYLNLPALGLGASARLPSEEYVPRLDFARVGQLFLGVSSDPGGVGFFGTGSLYFEDMLSNHQLYTMLQVSDDYREIGGELRYWNLTTPFTLGGGIAHIPQSATSVSTETGSANQDGEEEELLTYTVTTRRLYTDGASVLAAYPFSRNRRLEAATGYTRVTFGGETETIVYRDGVEESRSSTPLEAPSPLDLWQSEVAFVGDYSSMGFTGPARGRRYRLSLAPTVGSLVYLSARADYRQYVFLRPVTLALRLLHRGRYLQDAETDLLYPLTVSAPGYVRGYAPGSFDRSDCGDDLSGCPEYVRLFGSRLVVANVEVRVPVVGTDQLGLINFRYLPTTAVAFADAGVAWTQDELPTLAFDPASTARIPVASAGAALRFNILGVVVLEVYWAYPVHRPDARWLWGLDLAAGF